MNRPRKSNESYEAYKRNLKREGKTLESWLSGRLVWDANMYGAYRRGVKPTLTKRALALLAGRASTSAGSQVARTLARLMGR